MAHNVSQLTVRGIDAVTKQALVTHARQAGVSLNRYAVEALQQSAGVTPATARYQQLKQFAQSHAIPKAEHAAVQTALQAADAASLAKQQAENS